MALTMTLTMALTYIASAAIWICPYFYDVPSFILANSLIYDISRVVQIFAAFRLLILVLAQWLWGTLGKLSSEIVDQPNLPSISLPQKIWVFEAMENNFMIRDEYHYGLLAILRWMTHQNTHFGNPAPIQFEQGRPIAELNEYENPFTHYQNAVKNGIGICVTGAPGIGKNTFLYYILHLRRRLGLPTVWIAEENSPVVFVNDQPFVAVAAGFGVLRSYDMLIRLLPKDTWYLIDSNDAVPNVPAAFAVRGAFFIQAASPCPGWLQWTKKQRFTYFTMADWTISELIAGLQVQHRPGVMSPEELVDFRLKFGGSAWEAYNTAAFVAAQPGSHEYRLRTRARLLSPSTVREIAVAVTTRSAYSNSVVRPDNDHRLLSVYPYRADNDRSNPDGDRTLFTLASPTAFTTRLILQAAEEQTAEADAQFFHTAIGLKVGYGLAGDVYDHIIHQRIIGGGRWTYRNMNRIPKRLHKKYLHWKTDEGEPIAGDLVANGSLRLEPLPSPSNQKCAALRVEEFDSAFTAFVPGVWYRPLSLTHATFDAFYLTTASHAIALQATIASKHTVKEKDVEHLQAAGVQTITYLYVSPKYTMDSHGRRERLLGHIEWKGSADPPFTGVHQVYLDVPRASQ